MTWTLAHKVEIGMTASTSESLDSTPLSTCCARVWGYWTVGVRFEASQASHRCAWAWGPIEPVAGQHALQHLGVGGGKWVDMGVLIRLRGCGRMEE
jgi:hypothetical protein